MTTRKYSSRSQQTTLSGALTSSGTSATVISGSGLLGGVTISAGELFTVVIDPDTALEEIVDVSAVSTNTLTIVRGIDGSTGQAHSAGAVVRHMAIGRDYREANAHIEATTGHGATGAVVGTTNTQTLTNKTLTSPIIATPNIAGATISGTFTSTATISGGTITGAAVTGLSAPSAGSDATTKTYVDGILGSATAAATSATNSATSASAAATSATNAASSASAASTSATNAANSATSASTSASTATTQASNASTSATAASSSATSASTSATSASTSASAAATSATSSAASATAAATSATSAAASATASASSATAASSSAVVAASYASAAPEFRQYGAEGSILDNIPTRVHDAESLLKQAVWWIDSAHSGSSGQAIKNLGWGGSALDATAGSSTSADSNDPQYLAWDGRNYVYGTGVTANFLSTPDATALDIVGDIDLRIQVAMDDWTPAANTVLLSKFLVAGNQRSFRWLLLSTGFLRLAISTDGSTETNIDSSVVTGITDGTPKWVRVTLDVDNGASGKTAQFFTSDDGIAWTQLGTTVTSAGTTSIFSSTAQVEVGSNDGGFLPIAGKIYRAQILNGIDGVPVLDVDTSVIATGAATSFTALTGQTVTINRATSGRKTTVVTHPVWLFGTDDYMEVNNRWLEHAAPSANYVYLNGTAGNYMSSPDSAALDITGDIDLRVQLALDDWTPSTDNLLLGKWSSSNQSYYLAVGATTGVLSFRWSANGTTANTATSTVAPTVTDGSPLWVRVTFDVDNGAGGNTAKFYTSTDGTTWTQLGADVVTAGTTSIFSGSGIVEIGTRLAGTSLPTKGKFFRAQVYNGIAGTLVFDADASIITDGTASTFKERSTNAATVTINKSGVGTFVSTGNYLYLPGVTLNYTSTPDSAALDILGDIDLRIKVALDDWTPASEAIILGKSGPDSYVLNIQPTGILRFQWINAANTFFFSDSTVATGIADGATRWIRATLDVDNGAAGNTVTFFTSTDGITWTQLGSPVVKAGTTDIRNQTGALYVGGYTASGTLTSRGKFFRAQVLNGIDGTVAFDANFESSIVGNLPTTFTEGSTNAATVTVNYSGTAYRSCGVIASTYVYPGATNTFKLSSYSMLDFGASDDFTLVMATRIWNTPLSNQRMFYKGGADAGAIGARYGITTNTTLLQFNSSVNDGTNSAISTTPTSTNGQLVNIASAVNRTAQTITAYTNAVAGTPASTSTVGTLANPNRLRLGWGDGATQGQYADMEVVSAAIFRRALTAGEIATLNSYFQGRVS